MTSLAQSHPPLLSPRLALFMSTALAIIAVTLTGFDLRTGLAFSAAAIGLLLLSSGLDLGLYAVVAFLVLFIDGWAPHRSPENVVYRLGLGRIYLAELAVYALLAACLIRRFLDARRPVPEFRLLLQPPNKSVLCLAALLPAFAVYGVFRGHPLQDAFGYYEWRALFLAVVLYFLILDLVDSRKKALRLGSWFLLLASLKAAYFLCIDVLDLSFPLPGVFGAGPVAEGPESAMFGIAALIALALLLFDKHREPWTVLLLVSSFLVLSVNVALSEKRSVQFGLLVGLLVLCRRLPRVRKLRPAVLVAAALLVALLLPMVWSLLPAGSGIPGFISRWSEIAAFFDDPPHALSSGGTLAFHLFDYVDAWDQIRQRPLLGYGFGSKFDRAFTALSFVSDESAGISVGMVHSQYLHFWWKAGLPGLMVFLWLIVSFIRFARRSLPAVPATPSSALALAFYAAFWAELAMDLWGPQWVATTKGPCFIFFTLALLVVLSSSAKKVQASLAPADS